MPEAGAPIEIQLAFSDRPDLKDKAQRVFEEHGKTDSLGDYVICGLTPVSPYAGDTALQHARTVLREIAVYVKELRQRLGDGPEPSQKKRKLNNGMLVREAQGSITSQWEADTFEGLSFSVPIRKKLNLQISANRKSEGVRAWDAYSDPLHPEFGAVWPDINHVICLPVPEKAQAQKNFCVFSKGGDGITFPAEGENPGLGSTMIWTAADTKAKGAAEEEPTQAGKIEESLLKAKVHIQGPDDKEFVSELQPPGKRGQKAYHVKAFKGNKDGKLHCVLSPPKLFANFRPSGYLFFLPQGIFWGFKKPLLLFSFPVIESISYTSILQRTFNIVISARSSANADPQEHEFSMIDQVDFAGIDAYVKRHKLHDASLAEQRRAKKYNVNGVKQEEGAEWVEDEEESELTKAQREAEMKADDDEDDEEDENFDPGSEGESEGSGTSDDREEGDGDEDGDDEEADELGSEADDQMDE